MKVFLASCFISLGISGVVLASENPDDILRKADDIRCPAEDFVMNVSILDKKENKESKLEVFTKGQTKTLIKTLAPARDKGRNLLMLDESMWAWVPNLNRSVRVSLNQRLMGEAANGDISRMRWAGDYDVKIKSQDNTKWILDLVAKKKGLTYEKIQAHIEKSSYRPIKAFYLSLAGKPLKVAVFKEYKNLAGVERPSQIHIRDAKVRDKLTVIQIESIEKKSLPEAMFSQESLK